MYNFKNKEELSQFITKNFLTSAQVAEELNCTRSNISDLVKRGKLIPAVELSQTYLFWADDIQNRIESQPKAGRPKKSLKGNL